MASVSAPAHPPPPRGGPGDAHRGQAREPRGTRLPPLQLPDGGSGSSALASQRVAAAPMPLPVRLSGQMAAPLGSSPRPGGLQKGAALPALSSRPAAPALAPVCVRSSDATGSAAGGSLEVLGGSPRPWPNMQAPLPPHMLPSSMPSSVPLPHGNAEEVAGEAVQPRADAGDELAPDEAPAFTHSEAVPEDAEALNGLGDQGEVLAPVEAPEFTHSETVLEDAEALHGLGDLGEVFDPGEAAAFAHSEAVPEEAEALHGFGDQGEFEWSANDTVEAALSSLELSTVMRP